MLVKHVFNQTNTALMSVEKLFNILIEMGYLYVQKHILLD